MKKTLTNLLRSAFVAVCCICGAQAYAEVPVVVAAGGSSSDDFSCTIGETFVGKASGLLMVATDTDITLGVDGIYSDGEIIVGNAAADKALTVQLPEAMIAEGAYYNVYTVSGVLLASDKITASPYTIQYGDLLNGQFLIVTVNTSNGVVASYKLSK